jgi:hypothetical protein
MLSLEAPIPGIGWLNTEKRRPRLFDSPSSCRAGFGRNNSCGAIVYGELTVAFAGVLDQTVGKIDEANLVFARVFGIVFGEGIDDRVIQSFVTFCFDGGGTIGKGFFDIGDERGFVFELAARRLFFARWLLAHG